MNSTSLLENLDLSDNANDFMDVTVGQGLVEDNGGVGENLSNAPSSSSIVPPEGSSEGQSAKKRKIKQEMGPEEIKATSLLKLGAAIDKIWSMTSHVCRTTDEDLQMKTDSKGQLVFKAKCLKCGVWFTAQRSEYCFKVGNYKKHVSTYHMATASTTSGENSSYGKGGVQKSVFAFLATQDKKKIKEGLTEAGDGVVVIEDELEAMFRESETEKESGTEKENEAERENEAGVVPEESTRGKPKN